MTELEKKPVHAPDMVKAYYEIEKLKEKIRATDRPMSRSLFYCSEIIPGEYMEAIGEKAEQLARAIERQEVLE